MTDDARPMADKGIEVRVYRDGANEWRWTVMDMGNHRKLGDSGEGYAARRDCLDMAARLWPGAHVVVVDRNGMTEDDDE